MRGLLRGTCRALHVLALGLWAGALLMTFTGAVDLFHAAKPVCPRCRTGDPAPAPGTLPEPWIACDRCGARHHLSCLPSRFDPRGGGLTCAFGDGGTFGGAGGAPVGSAALFARAVVVPGSPGDDLPMVFPHREAAQRAKPEPLWRVERSTAALETRNVRAGQVSRLAFPAAGDAARRLFEVARLLGLALAAVALPTAFLSPPGGALRAFRVVAIAVAAGASAYGAVLGSEIATLRNQLDLALEPAAALANDLGAVHGRASALGAVELLAVVTALVLSTAATRETGGRSYDGPRAL